MGLINWMKEKWVELTNPAAFEAIQVQKARITQMVGSAAVLNLPFDAPPPSKDEAEAAKKFEQDCQDAADFNQMLKGINIKQAHVGEQYAGKIVAIDEEKGLICQHLGRSHFVVHREADFLPGQAPKLNDMADIKLGKDGVAKVQIKSRGNELGR